jgi:hypothetical protein
MIEITAGRAEKRLYLTINGVTYKDIHGISVLPVKLSGSGDGVGVVIKAPSREVQELLLQHRFSKFPKQPWTLELRLMIL